MEYSLDFSERLIDAANTFVTEETRDEEGGRAVLYLSMLSCEITLKALLEKAGFTISDIKRRSHDFNGLMEDICTCELTNSHIGNSKRLSASRLLSQEVVMNTNNGTVGTLLQAELDGASKYPNDIRYGDLVTHYPPLVMFECARVVSQWARDHISEIKRK